jgi:hypothetical protein
MTGRDHLRTLGAEAGQFLGDTLVVERRSHRVLLKCLRNGIESLTARRSTRNSRMTPRHFILGLLRINDAASRPRCDAGSLRHRLHQERQAAAEPC